MTTMEVIVETLKRHGKPIKPWQLYSRAQELGVDTSNLTGKTPSNSIQR